MDETTKPAYEGAVKGRRDFRAALREARQQVDGYGLALMMISEGCANPQKVAADALAKYRKT